MSKPKSQLKIEHGASKINWVLLKTNIEEFIATDIDRMCQWSNNDRKYVVNALLQFALEQSEAFQKYKAELETEFPKSSSDAKPVPVSSEAVSNKPPKSDATVIPTANPAANRP